jgi:hypothetical protein
MVRPRLVAEELKKILPVYTMALVVVDIRESSLVPSVMDLH